MHPPGQCPPPPPRRWARPRPPEPATSSADGRKAHALWCAAPRQACSQRARGRRGPARRPGSGPRHTGRARQAAPRRRRHAGSQGHRQAAPTPPACVCSGPRQSRRRQAPCGQT
eukprot:9543441-Alexandrium_andersonii.AAC.1